MTWQPIETAPKDRTRILAVWLPGHIDIVWWDFSPSWNDSRDTKRWTDGVSAFNAPDAWQPLPTPPTG